jgi:hypothetical protein
MNFGKEDLERIRNIYPQSEFAEVFYQNFHHFENIFHTLEGGFHYGCGSYLFDGYTYKYCPAMFLKQEALYNSCRNSKKLLELGVYLGHSLLIILLSNPTVEITCVDIDTQFTPRVVEYLNKYFNNRVKLLIGDSVEQVQKLDVNEKFDTIHIDSDHRDEFVHQEFTIVSKVAQKETIFIFDDYDAVKKTIDSWINTGVLSLVECPGEKCLYTNIITRYN